VSFAIPRRIALVGLTTAAAFPGTVGELGASSKPLSMLKKS
jgi:hypothetical protein